MNPEELIGAAHAGCFTMALTAALSRAGSQANSHSHHCANVKLEKVGEAFFYNKDRISVPRQKYRELTMRHFKSLQATPNRIAPCQKLWPERKSV